MESPPMKRPEKIKLTEINPYLTCYLCKGYLIDATTISECLHSFCRSCIIKFLQDNSYCPVCEVIINKAKPNLKLDKTLQDIVYKLVPELFLREMTRRKVYYQQYPQIAARVSPEERGEDTERTIFNPKDCISLSLEYVSDDSTPGAISLSDTQNEMDSKPAITEDASAIKRYLQCPGMCRIEVIKKFVQNKYNVDTKLFYIDILYKKVPLPDHYTLIDIAYIYSWKRNEPMRFFFRIIDVSKVSERFDHFIPQTPFDFVKTPVRPPRSNGDRSLTKKRDSGVHKKSSKISKLPSQENVTVCDKVVKSDEEISRIPKPEKVDEVKCKKDEDVPSVNRENETVKSNTEANKENQKVGEAELNQQKLPESPVKRVENNSEQDIDKSNKEIGNKDVQNKVVEVKPAEKPCDIAKVLDVKNNTQINTEIAEQMKSKIQSEKSNTRNTVFTNVHLNRTNNVEIITKFQKVSNKDGQAIGMNIINQTVKKNVAAATQISATTKKVQGANIDIVSSSTKTANEQQAKSTEKPKEISKVPTTNIEEQDAQKLRFMESLQLTRKKPEGAISPVKPKPAPPSTSQKRKNSSPVKNDKSKRLKLDLKKPATKTLLQPKPLTPHVKELKSNGLQSLIENCKIPSSLSITIKEGGDNNRVPMLLPPVKNYIEILKLPDENGESSDRSCGTPTKLDLNMICDNDSEQKVDQDLSEIAKSLTEKIPMSTTISQIVGPKPQFPIPIKSNMTTKPTIQPSPVPELPPKIPNATKKDKLTPSRSHQTFQKIFEESIKKPDGTPETQKSALDLSNETPTSSGVINSKRNILEIASQLYKKTKLEQEKKNSETKTVLPTTTAAVMSPTTVYTPKVAIPRLPTQRNLKPPPKHFKYDVTDPTKYSQTLANLHSNALGLNYTVSIGHSTPPPKSNGVVTPPKKEDLKPAPLPSKSPNQPKQLMPSPVPFGLPKESPGASPRPLSIPRNMSPGLCYSPRNSPKHSPKSSPLVKHMYAPMPNLIMDQLRVHTYNQKIPSPKSNNFGNLPSPSTSTSLASPLQKKHAHSPKPPASSPKTPKASSSSPQISTSNVDTTTAKLHSPISLPPRSESPKVISLPEIPSPSLFVKTASSSKSPSKTSPGGSSHASPMSPNQILEKYNIQNLAQLTASLNFNPSNFGMNPNQMAALQHAMLLKHFEMQNRQNWLNMNQGPLLQYEKYLQSLKNNQNHLLTKEN